MTEEDKQYWDGYETFNKQEWEWADGQIAGLVDHVGPITTAQMNAIMHYKREAQRQRWLKEGICKHIHDPTYQGFLVDRMTTEAKEKLEEMRGQK